MNTMDSDDISKSWILAAESNQSSNTYKENHWAIELMMDLPETNPEITWEVIEKIYKTTNNPKVLSYLAAGPLESLMCSFGERYLEKVRAESTNPNFIELMRQVRISSKDTPIYKEFYEIAGIEPPLNE